MQTKKICKSWRNRRAHMSYGTFSHVALQIIDIHIVIVSSESKLHCV